MNFAAMTAKTMNIVVGSPNRSPGGKEPLVEDRQAEWGFVKRFIYWMHEPMLLAIAFASVTLVALIAGCLCWVYLNDGPKLADYFEFPPSALLIIAMGAVLVGVVLWVFTLRHIAAGGRLPRKLLQETNLQGKVVIITGANTGIGKVCAEQMAKWGATVIMGCRNLKKGMQAVEDINKELEKQQMPRTGSVECLELDLSDLESVRDFAREILRRQVAVDILLNNAGIMLCPFALTKQGHESQFGVNHLGHFLLTTSLLPALRMSDGSRVVNLSSFAHVYMGKNKLSIPKIQTVTPRTYNRRIFYGISKLCNLLFTRELQRKLNSEGVNTYTFSLHPGVVRTELDRHLFFRRLLVPANYTLLKSPWQGAQTSLYACVAPLESLKPGAFYQDCNELNTYPCGQDDVGAQELWEYSEAAVEDFKA